MQEVVLFYNGLDVPTRQILDSRGAIPSKTVADAKVANSQKWHNGTSRTKSTETSDGLAAIQAQLNNLRREIKKVNEKVYAAQVGSEQCKGPHYTKDCPLKEEGKTLEEAYYTQFGASISGMPLSTYLNLGLGELAHTKLTVELADRTVKYPKGIAKNMLVGIGRFVFPVDFIILDMPDDIKVPLILERPFLSTAHAKIDVFKRKIALREDLEYQSLRKSLYLILDLFLFLNLDAYSRFNFGITSLIGFTAQSVRYSNAYALDSPYLLVLNTRTSQSRQHDMSESDSYDLSD
ncbi:putative reverse transcriptase domain-containing protein [Tanacetum coccineum]